MSRMSRLSSNLLTSLCLITTLVFASMPVMPSLRAEAAAPTVTAGQAQVTTISLYQGKSQLLKFAEPVTRISIAEPDMVELVVVSPEEVMLNGKKTGTTSMIAWDSQGREGLFDLVVQQDIGNLLSAVQNLAPNDSIDARVNNDTFILTGEISNSVLLDEIKRLAAGYGFKDDKFIDLTETPSPQVMLEVKIAEASRTVGRDLTTGFAHANGTFQQSHVDSAVRFAGEALGVLPQPDIINNVGGIVSSIVANRSSVNPFQIRWSLLENTGKLKTLAEPTLVAIHNETASFMAGGEVPFVKGVDQNGSPLIDYKEFGVRLNFTPKISMRSGRILLNVAPEVSELDTSLCVAGALGIQTCGLRKRRTETTVMLNDGETLLISGILTQNDQKNLQKIPILGDLPVLGGFFRNTQTSHQDRELIVVVTPHIVNTGRPSASNATLHPVVKPSNYSTTEAAEFLIKPIPKKTVIHDLFTN